MPDGTFELDEDRFKIEEVYAKPKVASPEEEVPRSNLITHNPVYLFCIRGNNYNTKLSKMVPSISLMFYWYFAIGIRITAIVCHS